MANHVSGSVSNRDGPQFNQSLFSGNVIVGGQDIAPQAPPEPSSTVPFSRDSDFVDRGDTLSLVREKLSSPAARVALVGLGGVGKSQLVIEYSFQLKEDSPQIWIFWVYASSTARFEQSYNTIADRVKLPGRDGTKTTLQLVHGWLSDRTNGRWLIILDNADDSNVLFDQPQLDASQANSSASEPLALSAYLPQAQHGSILVTSRDKVVAFKLTGSHNNIIEVPPMNEEQALKLLQRKLANNFDQDHGPQLVKELDYMPLAITQAAAFINQRAPRSSTQQYITLCRKSAQNEVSLLNKDHGDLRRDVSAKNSIITTWQISFEQIQTERRKAAEMLSLMSFFDRQGIPESLFRKGDEDIEFEDDVDTLRRYSLIVLGSDNISFEMHRLVQLATRRWLEAHDEVERWRNKYAEVLSQAFPVGTYENWPICRKLYPHVQTLLAQRPASRDGLEKWARAASNAAYYVWHIGDYITAENTIREVISVRQELLGENSAENLESLSLFASVLKDQGKYEESEKINRQSLEGCKMTLGEEHRDTLTSMDNLGLVLQFQGKIEEAEQMNRQALKAYRTSLGNDHPDTLTSLNNLSLILQNQGKYEEAEQMNRQVIEGYKESLGEEHPYTLIAISNLVLKLRSQEKWEEAEQTNRQVLEAREKVLGKDHPDTLTSVYSLALLYRKLGQNSEALALYKKACEGFSNSLGAEHPTTIDCLADYASLIDIMDER